MASPLEGLMVVELARILVGPWVGLWLMRAEQKQGFQFAHDS